MRKSKEVKIICIGRNYAKHAKELGNDVPEEPVIFLKPDSALMRQSDKFYIPDFTSDVHYEAELVIRIDRIGKNIQKRFAGKYYGSVSVGIDFTARDVQARLKEAGLPWEKAKAFDQSAAVGKWVNLDKKDINDLRFELRKNGEVVQRGHTADMIHKAADIIAHVSSYFTLKIGDLLFTGTPEGVGKVSKGDHLEGYLESGKVLDVKIR